jgi:ASC-1-like (ASCH) protein
MSEWQEINAGAQTYWDRKEPVQGVLVSVKPESGQYNTKLYVLEAKGGAHVGVNGTAVLDSKLDQVKVGTEVRIEPLGEAKSEKTGRTYQDFKVLTREVPFAEVTTESTKDEIALEDIPFS